jgi:hypothetical protein
MRRVSVFLFVMALSLRLTLLFGFHRYGHGNSECMGIARSLASGHGFADPYSIPTGPTAHCAPVYPAMSAPLFALFGETERIDVARFALNSTAAAAGYALMPAIAEGLGMGWPAGAVAALIGAVVPLHYWPECVDDFENSWSALFLEIAVLWLLRRLKSPPGGAVSAVRAGLLWGAGLLLAPTVITVLAASLGLLAWKRRLTARWTAVLFATLLVVLAPWTIRNYVQLGGLTFVRDNFGLELFISNQDEATPVFDRNAARGYWKRAHPHASISAAEELNSVGELAFNRRRLRQAVAWIRSHPRRFLSLTAGRVFYFWFPSLPRFQGIVWTITALAALGWLQLFFQNRFAAIVLATVALAYSSTFLLIQVTLRYQHPIWWALLLCAAWPAAALGYTKRLRSTPDAT